MYELKPCPFCGTPMNLAKDRTLMGFHDDDCFFCLLEEREVDMTEEELMESFVEAWNRRATDV